MNTDLYISQLGRRPTPLDTQMEMRMTSSCQAAIRGCRPHPFLESAFRLSFPRVKKALFPGPRSSKFCSCSTDNMGMLAWVQVARTCLHDCMLKIFAPQQSLFQSYFKDFQAETCDVRYWFDRATKRSYFQLQVIQVYRYKSASKQLLVMELLKAKCLTPSRRQ